MATLYIMYGSATGNAEQIAKDLAASFRPDPDGFSSCICQPLEKFKKHISEWERKPESGTKHGLLIVTSTTGNGDAPENASRFVRFIKRKTTSPSTFQHVAFSVLGLGDTNYDQFCSTGKVVDHRLTDLSGTRIRRLACADEAVGLEDVVEPWTQCIISETQQTCFPDSGSKSTTQPVTQGQMNGAHPSNAKVATVGISNGIASVVRRSASNSPTSISVEDSKAAKSQETSAETTSDSPATPLIILYASSTGNAEQIAKDLAATYETILSNPDSTCYFPSVICCAADEFKKRKLLETYWSQDPPSGSKHGLLIVASTTGNGDVPENGNRFSRWIKRKTTAPTTFQHVAYSVLGLGDTNYDQFCAAGVFMDKRLGMLGGRRVLPLAQADEATGLEDVVEPWTNHVLAEITNACRGDINSASSVPSNGGASQNASTYRSRPTPEEQTKQIGLSGVQGEISEKGTTAVGVEILRTILSLDPSAPVPCVPNNDLPSIGTSLSSCQLVDHEFQQRRSRGNSILSEIDRATISSDASSVLYRHNKPCERGILKARYLTETSTEAAKEAAQLFANEADWKNASKLMEAMQVYERRFPLEAPSANGKSRCANKNDLYERNGKRVIELTISLPEDYTLEYKPGDSLGLRVPNLPSAVQFVLDMLKRKHSINSHQPVSIDSKKPITVEEAVRSEIDLCTPLQKNHKRLLVALADYATVELEAAALRYLASKTGEQAFKTYIEEQAICFVDLLKDFPSSQVIPLEGLIALLPAIPPRYYSVSSSPLESTPVPCLTIAFSIVDYLTPPLGNRGRRRKSGVATRYLEVLASPSLVSREPCKTMLPIFPKPTNDFHLPDSVATPLILIGPGTGIAPFVGFLKHRYAQAAKSKEALQQVVEGTWRGEYEIDDVEADASNTTTASTHTSSMTGPISVFFGCRHADHDWLYRKEMTQFQRDGLVTNLYTAFSRDGGKLQRYVQDMMREKAKEQLMDMILKKHATVYVCGDGNAMAKDVQATLLEILRSGLGGQSAASGYLDQMKTENRFLLDIWS